MAIDNNSTVAISIVVKDDGSIALIDAAEGKLIKLQNVSVGAGSAVGKVASGFGLAGANLSTFGTSLSTTTQQMSGISNATVKTGQDLDSAGEKTKSLNGHMRELSGEARELGLNMGYSLRRFLSESPAVMTALRSLEIGFVALGAVDIGLEAIDGVEKLYEKWFDVSKAVNEYQEKAAEAAVQKLFDSGSLETEISLLKQATDEVDRLNQKKEIVGANEPGGGFFQTFQGMRPSGIPGAPPMQNNAPLPRYSGLNDEQNAAAQKNRDEALERTQTLQSQFAEQRLQSEAAYDSAALKGYDAINARQRDGIALAQQHLAATKEHEQTLQKITEDTYALQKAQGVPEEERVKIYKANPNAGNAEYDADANRLGRQASGDRVALARQENDQLIQMQNAAIDAGVRGEALYAEQQQQAQDEVRNKMKQGLVSQEVGLKEIASIDMKFHNEKMQRLEEEQYQTLKIQQEAQQSGLTGIAKVQADTQNRVTDLTENPANVGLSDDAIQKRRVAYEQQGDADILAERQNFNEQMNELVQRGTQQQTSGYARIEADATAALGNIAKEWEATFGKLDVFNPSDVALMVQGAERAGQAVNGVLQNADRERQQYSQQVNEQITQTEAQAARLILPPWQAAQQQIGDEYAQRLAKAKQELTSELAYNNLTADDQRAIWDTYNRQVVAANALANAQMQHEAQQSRDQIAGQLEQLFSDPGKYMQNRAKQMMMDIIANWVQQLEQSNPRMQGILGGLLGQNKMGVGSPRQGIWEMFGGHHAADHAAPMSESLGMPSGPLNTAGSTLTSAGMTLSSSGTMLMDAATQISTAASQLGTSNPVGPGGVGGFGGSASGFSGSSPSPFAGMPSFVGGGSISTPEIAGTGSGLSGAFSVANTATGGIGSGSPSPMAPLPTGESTVAGVVGGFRSAMQVGSTLQQIYKMSQGTSDSGSSGGGFQPNDFGPTNDAGVVGTLPGSDGGDDGSGDDGSGDSGSGSSGTSPLGMGMGLVSGGMGLFGAWQQASNSKSFAGGLMGMASGALAGATIGTMFAPGIGTAIGAAAGAAIGLLGDIFGDHGRSKAEQYNVATVIPTLQRAMDGFSSGGGYDSTSVGITNLRMQAQQQTRSWGSGAVDYYNGTIVPEIKAAQAQVDREGAGGRSNVTMSAAQFDSGGVITSFGDMSTGPFSGFIHARMGERVMNPMASMTHASTLDAMNAGTAALSMMRRTAPLGGGSGMTAGDLHVHVHALDVRDFEGYLRRGGGAVIQQHLNQKAAGYAGRALNAI